MGHKRPNFEKTDDNSRYSLGVAGEDVYASHGCEGNHVIRLRQGGRVSHAGRAHRHACYRQPADGWAFC